MQTIELHHFYVKSRENRNVVCPSTKFLALTHVILKSRKHKTLLNYFFFDFEKLCSLFIIIEMMETLFENLLINMSQTIEL